MAPCSNAGHPGNDYYVNLETGAIQRMGSLLGHVIGLGGYWGPMDWCQAKAFAANYTASGALHGSAEGHAAGSALNAAGSAASAGLGGLGDFFHRLTESQTWVRVGEFFAGGLIFYVGMKGLVSPAGADVKRQTAKQTWKLAKRVIKK